MKALRYRNVLLLVLTLVVGLVLGACGRDLTSNGGNASKNQATTVASGSSGNNNSAPVGSGAPIIPALNQTGQVLNPTGNLENDIKAVAKAVRPAVVLIAVTVRTGGGGGIFGGQGQIGQGVGTGSILTQDGYILTNNHVVEGATGAIQVALPDGRRYTGRLIGREGTNNDLAVIKIDPKAGETLPTIKMGDSSKLEVGDFVVAIGNALALPGGPSLTAGVVSNIGRSIQEPNGANLTDLIQTDAAINPGNSGGPLLNLKGEIVGINTAAAVNPEENTAAQSIGFAININQAQQYIQAFVKGGGNNQNSAPITVSKPFMGILPQTMTAALATRYNLPADQGVLVARVDANSPAAKAGWKAGDIMIAMDNQQIASTNDLSDVLSKHKAGDTVTAVLVGQDGKQRQTQITFGQAPAN